MPNKRTLKIGDRIRLLFVPQSDLDQREREILAGDEEPGCTADVLEIVIKTDPVVTISIIDEYHPWFIVDIVRNGRDEEHSLAVMDDTSWEFVGPALGDESSDAAR